MPVTQTDTNIPGTDADVSDQARSRIGKVDELLQIGTVIDGRYRIDALLGEGGMGAVYAAEHVKVGRRVAFKVLGAHWATMGIVARRFRDEARAASAAGHPNIIEVFDAGELLDGRPYLVMELLEGRELASVIAAQGGLEPARACRIIRDVARALDAAHARGVIHRDLKGENVMLVGRGDEEIVKVLDFGIAANSAALGPRATTPGLIIGTPAYMAPEQAKGVPPTIAFDIYALGVLLHDALTGQVPFEHMEGLSLLSAKTSQPAPSIGKLREDLPMPLVQLVDSCLALDPSLRPATAREVADRLSDILDELPERESRRKRLTPAVDKPFGEGGTERTPAPPALWGRADERSRRGVVVLVAVLFVLLSGGVAWWVLDQGSSQAVASASEPPAPVMPKPSPQAPDVPPPIDPTPNPATHVPLPPEPEPEPELAEEPPRRASPGQPDPTPRPEPRKDLPAPTKDVPAVADTPGAPAPDSALCWRTRKQAQQAREIHDWSGVLRHTRSQSCWAEQRDQRKKLRTKAYMELGRWDDCVDASRGLNDPEGRRWQDICNRRKEKQG